MRGAGVIAETFGDVAFQNMLALRDIGDQGFESLRFLFGVCAVRFILLFGRAGVLLDFVAFQLALADDQFAIGVQIFVEGLNICRRRPAIADRRRIRPDAVSWLTRMTAPL